jgi:hypothetical protein
MKSLVAGQHQTSLSYWTFLLCSIDSFWLFDPILILVLFYSTYALYVLNICPSSSRYPATILRPYLSIHHIEYP